MIRISGNTFPYKEELKDFGAKWNGDLKSWEFRDGTNVDRWRGKPGLVITGADLAPIPAQPTPDRQPMPGKPIPLPVSHGIGEPAIYGNDITYLNAFSVKNPPMFAGFRSFPDLVDFIEAIPDTISADSMSNRNTGWKRDNSKWSGSASMADAISMARNGWTHGVDLASEASEIITAAHAVQRVRKYAVAGGRVNVGRMLSGNPLHMVSRPKQPGQKVITLFVQTWMSAGITPENAIIRAASVAAMADVLDANGFSCEIVAVGTSKHSGQSGPGPQIATVIKAAGEPLSINDVAFALGHPSMLRRFMFAVCAVEPQLHTFWFGMGGQADAFEPNDLPPGSFYIPKLLLPDQERVTGDTFKDRVRSLFPLIVPKGLQINLQ